jgi:hypothetical protein
MSDISEHQKEAQTARSVFDSAESALYDTNNRLRNKQEQLAQVSRLGEPGLERAQALQAEIKDLQNRVARNQKRLRNASETLNQVLEAFPLFERPWELVEQLDDRLPFLLLPVRLETRFMDVDGGKELWVRIFPDDIAIHTHELELTADEVADGQSYWRERWTALHDPGDETPETIEKGAWRVLAEAYGGPRAAWIAGAAEPESLDVGALEDLKFPAFDPDNLKQESWSRAPRTKIMPDRFVVSAYSGNDEIHRVLGKPIPDPLYIGPDPQAAEEDFAQQGGDLTVGENLAWIYDFDQAVATGMGVRIGLEEPFASQGFDRIFALGLRLSAGEEESQSLLEELLLNHRYSPDGMSLVPQGTPTNNMGANGSGFGSDDPGAEESFKVETGDPQFSPATDEMEKSDGQRLADALGIGYGPLERVQFAGRRDVVEAIAMNKALWHGTLGYYLEEMLGLNLAAVRLTREFFTDYVAGRGPLPAIRVGTQPYGVLLTSDFTNWQWSRLLDGERISYLNFLTTVINEVETTWRELSETVPHVGAGGDPFENLLSMLGLHATSVEHHRRQAVGRGYIWNYEAFNIGTFFGRLMMEKLNNQAQEVLQELGLDSEDPPRLFDLSFFLSQDEITDPLVDDIPAEETEKLSESKILKEVYQAPDPEDSTKTIETDYIGWLVYSAFDDLKGQQFKNQDGESLPIPRPLLYRMLRGALLQAYYDASMRIYTAREILPIAARSEVELGNVRQERTVTRWEFMGADVSQIVPELSQVSQSMGAFLQSEQGLNLPEAFTLQDARDCLESLIGVTTARLERLFVEHLDLCTYRLDAWQTGFFHRRLQQLRQPEEGEHSLRTHGIYLGAFGWLEDLHPGPELVPADLTDIPASLHDPEVDGPIYTQPDNGGFIHGPSINHAVTAAVLRNAYITHLDTTSPEKMAINLSSERVRKAQAILEGIRNGQMLGALLGYQFERGLHDNHNDPGLNQYIPFMRQRYPLMADKITQEESGADIDAKESRNVLDGYALVEVAFLKEEPEPYPYDIDRLPPDGTDQAKAIKNEVSRMADTLDAIADLAQAEGVFQVAQGNFDRAGAMMKAFTEGNSPPEPDIVRTPRSGAALTQRMTLHFETGPGVASIWPGSLTKRAQMEPGMNRWLGQHLPTPNKIKFAVQVGDGPEETQSLAKIALQPIDLIYLIGDELADESTELENRIAHFSRFEAGDDEAEITISFMTPLPGPDDVTLFELLPLLRSLRDLVTGSRPLGADDFALQVEDTTDPAVDPNPQGYDLSSLDPRVVTALDDFEGAADALSSAIPLDADDNPVPALADADLLRSALLALAEYGLPNAFPDSAIGTSDQATQRLLEQAVNVDKDAAARVSEAEDLIAKGQVATDPVQSRVDHYRAAAQQILGASFNLVPQFNMKNAAELQAAIDFRDSPADTGLLRFHESNPHLVAEWFQGVIPVRARLGSLETAALLGEAFNGFQRELKPLQLPFRDADHWIAVEYPEVPPEDLDLEDVFVPIGDFLSIVQQLPADGIDPTQLQSGLLIDEWVEVIPNKREATGIAVHYDQPNTEPPQVLLLAVTPQVTGSWSWEKLTGILHNTLDRAKLRLVEPDQLGSTPYGHLLPAVLSAVTTYPFGTLSTDFVHQTAVMGLDLDQDDG